MGADLSPSVSPVSVSFSLATAPMSPACSSVTGTAVFPCMIEMCASFSCELRLKFMQRRVVLQHAGENFEVGNAAGEGIGHGLEHIERNRLGVGLMPLGRLAIARRAASPCTHSCSEGAGV